MTEAQHSNSTLTGRRRQRGQAMTEMNVVAAFVLVPLLLMIPMLAKFIDMKLATIQAARYQAWEYTAWYENTGQRSSGFSATAAPVKSLARTAAEAEKRFFGPESRRLAASDANGIRDPGELKDYWRDHAGRSLVRFKDNLLAPSQNTEGATPTLPVLGNVADALYKGFDAITSLLASVMSLIGSSVGFTVIELDRYSNASVTLQVTDNGVIRNDAAAPVLLDFRGQAGVLTEPWNAGGIQHVSNQVGGLVPTALIGQLWDKFTSLPVVSTLWSIITFFLPEFSSDCLKFGYIEPDNVPPAYLESGGSHACADGLCQFSPEPSPPPGNCGPNGP